MLELNRVSKRLGGNEVLSEISFGVPAGQTRALIGSSGAGKTTLLRLILGLISADAGTIQLAGQSSTDLTPTEWARRIGYVPQQGGLFPHISVADNVTLIARNSGWRDQAIAERLEAVRALVGLGSDLLTRWPHELSGGQVQRAAIMRAMFLDPPVMLLDEPMAALDPVVRSALQAELRSLFERLKKTVLLVTHDLGEAVYFARQITLLHEGRLVQSGSYSDLSRHPASDYVTLFLNAQRTLPDDGALS